MVQRLKDSWDRFRTWWRSRPRLEDQPVPEEDPIVSTSLSWPIAISAFLLALSLLWALYDEGWGLRPWRSNQREFAERYVGHLKRLEPKVREEEKALFASEGYRNLSRQIEEAGARIKTQQRQIDKEESDIKAHLQAITKTFATARSEIQAKIYEVETAEGGRKKNLQEELEELKKKTYELTVPMGGNGNGGEREKSYTYEELEREFKALKFRQGQLQAQRVDLLRSPGTLRREREAYVQSRLTELSTDQVRGLIAKMENFTIEIKQIHNAEMNLVDRCESCHVGTREPVVITKADMGGNGMFVSHPNRELLDIHDPEIFGCSPCHNGNGTATIDVTKAHGQYKHWLWPLYARENFEAGCLQCHEAERRLDFAPVLNAGKELYYVQGCWGCHPREWFDPEPRALRDTQKTIEELNAKRAQTEINIARAVERADRAASNEEANRLYAEAENLTLSIAKTDAQLHRLGTRVDELLMEIKNVGPNLKEVRNKLRGEWIPVWIQNPYAFRPTTKMPRFRLERDQVQAIAAFLWQSGIEGPLPQHPPGDPANGKLLFQTRGCLACHSIGLREPVERLGMPLGGGPGHGMNSIGGAFAANLSRVGEKVNYDYLVRWIHNPRERTLPYCPVHKRDITPDDYAGKGWPFEFSLEKDQCPLGPHTLQVQQTTVMPNLRLTWEDSRDIASYLMAQKHPVAGYPPAPYLEDRRLFEKGRFLVRHYGCAGCHEIAKLEDEGKIGTELTEEGSKPIERLDFALLTDEAKDENWYNHKGFFEHKLADPAVYDQGRIKEPLERLRMPHFDLTKAEIDQFTTFLLGSVDSQIPEKFFYRPPDQRRDIQDGWWVVAKYNCMACHQFAPGQKTILQGMPLYQTPEGRDQLPPSLIGEGVRVDPNWLAQFLKNPALSTNDLNKNGVRPYLQARMPTFNLSDGEIQKLVRFFQALSNQPLPYMPTGIEPLTDRELTLARQLFTHSAAPCLRCHATGDPVHDRTATAPNFLLAKERLQPAWTERWIVHPEIIRPGTAMPSGLFRWDGSRWVFALAELESFKDYPRDHASLVVRYMLRLTSEEQGRLKAH